MIWWHDMIVMMVMSRWTDEWQWGKGKCEWMSNQWRHQLGGKMTWQDALWQVICVRMMKQNSDHYWSLLSYPDYSVCYLITKLPVGLKCYRPFPLHRVPWREVSRLHPKWEEDRQNSFETQQTLHRQREDWCDVLLRQSADERKAEEGRMSCNSFQIQLHRESSCFLSIPFDVPAVH